ncbi:LysR family transcriptional regulator [Paraburkholderia sp. D15]|uniref:LysR family transcriptional regulator n=1 Tax=Paraburkholderia sp. D15 TaxID=2880218 RepID=UPI00247858F5|nr:LysR family transcriptional regulator [Paraburkholderia sp. D15]WGS52260.1 LysR family transcriptional regulator [Paraburkholderia sp. D15]WKF59456.1 Nodulation protein D 2 [Paraburkholderia busanensis]
MQLPDLNLLIALDALLEEGSVVGAAQRMHLSAPAMSRTLARIRDAVGDPILVKIGRRMVPTPRALALRDQVRASVESAVRLLQPERDFDIATLERRFNLQANDTFTSPFGGAVLDRVRREAPRSVLRFEPANDIDAHVVLEGNTDLLITSMRPLGPDIHMQTLFTTTIVGLARDDHPIFDEEITPQRFAACDHISVSRRGLATGPIDGALAALGLARTVSLVVPSFHNGVFALGASDLISAVPEHVATAAQALGIRVRPFPIPMPLETIVVIQAWHPRFQSDPAHQWLRRVVREVCGA